MLQLLLLRHAKAEREGAAASDHERPLTDRGRRDAAVMGRLMAAAELAPDLVLSSSAERARATAKLAVEAAGWRTPLRETPALYESSIAGALDVVRAIERGCRCALLVGHEPTWSALGGILSGGSHLRLPTAGLVVLGLDLDDWGEVGPGSALLEGLIAPALVAELAARRRGQAPSKKNSKKKS